MKKRARKQSIPDGAFAGLLADIRQVRSAATRPRTPEDYRKDQEVEHRIRREANEAPSGGSF